MIRDTQSENGVLLNDRRIGQSREFSEPVQMFTGDILVCMMLQGIWKITYTSCLIEAERRLIVMPCTKK